MKVKLSINLLITIVFILINNYFLSPTLLLLSQKLVYVLFTLVGKNFGFSGYFIMSSGVLLQSSAYFFTTPVKSVNYLLIYFWANIKQNIINNQPIMIMMTMMIMMNDDL